ncbi:UNVERIFIED_CONTAM: hypothetical protein GTU68_040304 [Idotea baltica]|nr:hypothetical protein [Idotea baltica]
MGNEIGSIEKLEAHQKGVLHKAFSILIFNDDDEILLQQRAFTKYHTPGLWSNSCCSHPHPKELLTNAAHRRLVEELGFNTDLKEEFSFVYKFYDQITKLWEHEHDTVYTGIYNGEIPFNPEEINAVKWVKATELDTWMKNSPKEFTFWFKEFYNEMLERNLITL